MALHPTTSPHPILSTIPIPSDHWHPCTYNTQSILSLFSASCLALPYVPATYLHKLHQTLANSPIPAYNRMVNTWYASRHSTSYRMPLSQGEWMPQNAPTPSQSGGVSPQPPSFWFFVFFLYFFQIFLKGKSCKNHYICRHFMCFIVVSFSVPPCISIRGAFLQKILKLNEFFIILHAKH